jgi:hypothetical protein
LLTAKVASWVYTKLTAIVGVATDAVINLVGVSTVAFYRSVDCLNGCPESLTGRNSSVAIAVHIPKPERSLPRGYVVLSHRFRVIQQIDAQVIPSCTIIIIPGELQGATSIVLLPGCARIFGIGGITVIALVYLLDVAQTCQSVIIFFNKINNQFRISANSEMKEST